MPAFPSFPKELQSDEEEGEDEAEADELNPAPTNPANEEKEPKEPEKDEDKTESVSIATDHGEEEANPTSAPLVDSTVAIPPPSTEQMTEQDHEINRTINDLTKSDDEEDDVPINSLKRKLCYKHAARKSTRTN